jgi:hypothetical protein
MNRVTKHLHYDPPVEFHKAMPGAKSVVLWKRDDDDDESRADKPRKPKPKSRSADYAGVDEEGFIPNSKRENNMTFDYDTSRGPYHAILDKMARAHQAITGDSYAKSFTAVYTDPRNSAIRDASSDHDLAKAHDYVYGTKLSAKAAPMDEVQDDVDPASAEYEFHRRVVTRMKANPGLSYERSFTHEFIDPANRSLKERLTSEGLQRMRAMTPTKPLPDYGHPGDKDYRNPNIGRSGAKPKGYAGG